MEYTLLPDLAPHKIHAKIQVHVSRKWLFRGATDSGPLQHVDMVLSDREGNAIYAEIPGNLAEQKATNIEEGGVYDISRFRVCAAKTVFKIVDGDKMIQFTFHTIVKRATSPPTTFPLYVYRLTSFDLIEPHVQTTNNFVGVYLSGGPACRWYFNPTIPEAEPYLTSQSTKRIVLQLPQNLQHPPAMETKPIVEHKSLYELLTVNPYDFPKYQLNTNGGFHLAQNAIKQQSLTLQVVRKLLYSETDNMPKAYSISFTQLSFIHFKIYANKSNINSPEKDDGDKETAQNFDICSLIQYPITKEKDQQIQLNRHLKGSNKGRYASEKKWTSNPPRTKVSLRSSSTF
ncbi:General transcription factor 2-related zinc finger protein [Zea mays]|uniref:General transcription factor 2-related zinc finger protein n=1 Tax=Zea mays TaxID=4577 RepID=A0A1D6PU70_MAIZE|nr:General transcription factor 2-related zinc finger protein [Zea mays]AQK50179.1 General transcription factor 2-related zinc finger protein [Zea mays]AQK50182.1 General transcription factor 2-related zinc finger protein [Zea mays]AQK50183.1 General transcription factor 2-related zinc finger protein [Zea mays]AQK50185.1 General transcription factor 2-related zinc finger protein [Zea mays]